MKTWMSGVFVAVSIFAGSASAEDPTFSPSWLDQDKAVQGLVRIIQNEWQSQGIRDFDAQMDFIRKFVNENSVHQGGHWHDTYGFSPRHVAYVMHLYVTGETDFKPHLSCGPRAYVMKELLDEMRIPNRRTYAFNTDGDVFDSHTFLEVMDSATGRWQLQDPDFNIYYRRLLTGERVSTTDLLIEDPNLFEPCKSDDECGWEKLRISNIRNYFSVVVYDLQKSGGRTNIALINTAKVSPTKVFKPSSHWRETREMTAEEVVASRYSCTHFRYYVPSKWNSDR